MSNLTEISAGPYGTEAEDIQGAFALVMTNRPAERKRINRASHVMAARAAELHRLLSSQAPLGEKLAAQAAYDHAVREHNVAMLAFFDLDPAR